MVLLKAELKVDENTTEAVYVVEVGRITSTCINSLGIIIGVFNTDLRVLLKQGTGYSYEYNDRVT